MKLQDNSIGTKGNKKDYWSYAFRWGTIIGFVTFIWYLIGFYTKFDTKTVFSDVYFFIDVALIGWMIVSYKRLHQNEKIKFSRIMLVGFYSSLVVAGFYALYFILRIAKLDPLFFQNYMYEATQMLKNMSGIDYTKVLTVENTPILQASFIFALYAGSVFNSMIYTLLISGFLYLNERIYRQ